MWHRRDFEAGLNANHEGPGGGLIGWEDESSGQSSLPRSRFCDRRRQSTVSDSGDTGIGTYCSDSLKDDSSESTTPLHSFTLSQQHLNREEDGVPSVPASPRIFFKTSSSSLNPGHWDSNRQATSPVEALSSMDVKGHQPIRRSSSFTSLSSRVNKSSMKTPSHCYSPGTQGSLDRNVVCGQRKKQRDSNINLYLPLSSTGFCNSFLQRSPGANPRYGYKHGSRSTGFTTEPSPTSSHPSPVKYSLNCQSPHEAKASGEGQQVRSLCSSDRSDWPAGHISPMQPAFRTQMWLTEQMEYRPTLANRSDPAPTSAAGTEDYAADRFSSLHHEPELYQMLMGTSFPGNTLLKVKEKLLRERELEIQSQKQQILQLHVWINENEHRAQQVLDSQRGQFHASVVSNTEESAMKASCKPASDALRCAKELKELPASELEVLHLNRFFEQITLRYSEEIRKLEEKIKTRDRYIASLKKKFQRESEQNRDKQQRIETLENYLSDLPTLNQVQAQSKQERLEEKNRNLENTVCQLQRSIEEGCALIRKKDVMIEMQTKTENELMASVQRLHEKVERCLEDGVRMPVQDLKNLEEENSQLLQQRDYSSMVLRMQREEVGRLTSQLMATSARLLKNRGPAHPPVACSKQKEETLVSMLGAFSQDKGKTVRLSSQGSISEMEELLKEMSLCLLDLRSFCCILAQRAQGKEPNLSLLLRMKSLSVSAEEQEHPVAEGEEELSSKLLEVGLLKRGIDELRRTVGECCPQYVGESCATQ